jgi:hypothetical protein
MLALIKNLGFRQRSILLAVLGLCPSPAVLPLGAVKLDLRLRLSPATLRWLSLPNFKGIATSKEFWFQDAYLCPKAFDC